MTIYAKSRSATGQPTLEEHSKAVCESMRAVFGTAREPTRAFETWARFFRLEAHHLDLFFDTAMAACALHDIGKANDGFQSAVSDRGLRQLVQHEHLSVLLLMREPLRSWLSERVDFEILLASVAGHHLRFSDEDLPRLADREKLEILDYSAVVTLAARALGTETPGLTVDAGVLAWENLVDGWRELSGIARAFRKATTPGTLSIFAAEHDEGRHRLLLAVRAALIVADSTGSGLVRTGRSIPEWIGQTLGRAPLYHEEIRSDVVEKRVHAVESRIGKTFRWETFQENADNLPARALLVAPCGAGKTLAAWRWIEGRLRERPAGRALFLYPTRGTATEGFRDYVSWAPEADAALVHGTAEFDLEGMFGNPSDERAERDYTSESRLFALGHWSKRIFSATVDTFLGAMAHQYGSMCLLPVLADAVVVIDEVHSFSPSMFAALLAFLERFDVPVLCMTASLPASRKSDLERAGLVPAAEGSEELERIASAPRYRVHTTEQRDAKGKVEEALGLGKRVLWVVNRVDECQQAARSLAGAAGDAAVHCYHSRFRLFDRRERHEEVIRLFQMESKGRGSVVFSTQVCEMSLDLDADVLVTEAAPVPALIQRMGRCCRVREPGARRGEVLVYRGEMELPYAREDVEAGMRFAEKMAASAEVSQADLGEFLAEMDGRLDATDQWVAFWNSGFHANARDQEFRDGMDFNVDCVLDVDLEHYLKASRREAPGFVVPVPRSERPAPDSRLGRYRVARSDRYSSEYGYEKGR